MEFKTGNIRNVGVFGHSGSGKTTLVETMVFESKGSQRKGSIKQQNTLSDYTNIEKEKEHSIFSTPLHANWKSSKINIIDTPGYDDFIGEVLSTLKVIDTAIMTINAQNGIEVGTEIIWDYIQEYKKPTIFVINQMDKEKANYENTIEQLRHRFGKKILPIQIPVDSINSFDQIVDALRMVNYKFNEDGGKPSKIAIPEALKDQVQDMHNAIVEAAAENDEALMEKYFEEGSLSETELAYGLTLGISQQSFFPVFICSAENNIGSGRIMGFINDICPSPEQAPNGNLEDGSEIDCNPADPTSIFIYKTISEPSVGTVSYFKVYAGKIKAGDELTNAQSSENERIPNVYICNGKERTGIKEYLHAGDLGVLLKLKSTHTNDTLNAKGSSHKIEPINFPESKIRTAFKAKDERELEKLIKVLHTIENEDPTILVENNSELKQILLHGQGQQHLELIKYRILKVYNLEMHFERPAISYRETISSSANSVYRHKKQSGGSGQFAEIHLKIEPLNDGPVNKKDFNVKDIIVDELPWGGKLELIWCIVGGSIDSKYINAIKKGIIKRMEGGPLTGSCVQDIRVYVYDGKMHSVDTNDMAFMLAASYGFKEAFENAKSKILEPFYKLEVLCPSDITGDIMADLQSRRAIIQGMNSEGAYQKIVANVPQAEMYQYASTIRAISQGKAKFSRILSHYELVPPNIQSELIGSYKQTLPQ